MKFFILFLITLLSPALAAPPCGFEAKIHRTGPSEAIIGITLSPEENWHTYWSNPGDSGMALSISLDDSGLKVLAEDFTPPLRFEAMGAIGYGYDQPATFLYHVSGKLPEQITGSATWLVCDDTTCLPLDQPLKLALGKISPAPEWFTKAQALLPSDLSATLNETRVDEEAKLITYSIQSEQNLNGLGVFPYDSNLSESKMGHKITQKGDRYEFSFKYIGDAPTSASFLLTGGKEPHKITLYESATDVEEGE